MGIYWGRFLKGLLEGVTQLGCHFPTVFPACSHESYPCLGLRYLGPLVILVPNPLQRAPKMGELNSWCRARMAMSQEWQRTLKLLTSLVCAAKASGNLGEIWWDKRCGIGNIDIRKTSEIPNGWRAPKIMGLGKGNLFSTWQLLGIYMGVS